MVHIAALDAPYEGRSAVRCGGCGGEQTTGAASLDPPYSLPMGSNFRHVANIP